MTASMGVRIFLGVVILAVVAAVGYGIYLSGSPVSQRALRLDQQRVDDLRNISFAIDNFWQTKAELPASLDDLRDSPTYVRSINDPETRQPYEYRVLEEPVYEVCATFKTDSALQREEFAAPFSESVWEHGVGRVCFEKEAKSAVKSDLQERPVIPARP